MKITKFIIVAIFIALASATVCFSASKKAYNMYGMGLQKAGKSNYTVKNLHQYDKYIADPLMLPDVLVPYKPTITAFDENSLKNVIPDTIAYKTNAAGKKLTILVYKSNKEKAEAFIAWIKSLNKSMDIPDKFDIHFNFNEKGEKKFSNDFSNHSEISVLFSYLSEKVDPFSEYDLITPKGESLRSFFKDKIYNIFKTDNDVDLSLLYLGLDISNDVLNEYSTTTTMIGAPITDLGSNLGIVLYNSFSKEFKAEIIQNKSYPEFSHYSAYCNGKNKLYISLFYLRFPAKTAPAKRAARTANSGAGLAAGACVSADPSPFPMIWMRPAGLA